MTDTSVSGGQDTSNSKDYTCESCGEELEYITTYKQWYCYSCQTYIDLPEPSSIDSEPEPEPEPESKAAPELDSDSWHEEAQEPAVMSEPVSESELEPEQTLSWDDAGIEFDEDGEDTSDVEEDKEDEEDGDDDDDDDDDASVESDEPLDSDEPAQELSWDDAMDSEDSEDNEDSYDQSITDAGLSAEATEATESTQAPLGDIDYTTTTEEVTSTEESSEDESEEQLIMAGPIAGVDPEFDEIKNLSDDEIEIEIDQDYEPSEEKIEIIDHTQESSSNKVDAELKKKALTKLHQAWMKVNSLRGTNPNDPRVLQLGEDLKRAMEGDFDPRDGIILAEESIEEADKLQKELKESTHRHVSDMFHFVSSKIILAKKIGFEMENLEEELDNVTSLIARGEYHRASSDLEICLQKIYDLPNTQDEIMIGLDPQSDVLQELIEPLVK